MVEVRQPSDRNEAFPVHRARVRGVQIPDIHESGEQVDDAGDRVGAPGGNDLSRPFEDARTTYSPFIEVGSLIFPPAAVLRSVGIATAPHGDNDRVCRREHHAAKG